MPGTKLQPKQLKKTSCSDLNSKPDQEAKTGCSKFVSLGKIAEAKKAAFRRGIWFRTLTRVERGIMDLTMKYVDDIKSTMLAKVLTAIMEKLAVASENMVERLVRIIGRALAQKASELAVSWGNISALIWAQDSGFARYLAVNQALTR